ncbi:ChaN family lipoprotein [bacterium]|nr:ChaN family lipoprotein [bacterium]
MKKYFFMISVFFALSLFCFGFEYKVFNGATGHAIPFSRMINSIAKYSDVIFVGEKHDDVYTHVIENRIFTNLYRFYPQLALSMEMFERDVQKILDAYLFDKISREEFLKKSRAWPKHMTDYHPMVAFAKRHHLPVIAANIPRKYASLVAKKGWKEIEKLPYEKRKFIAEKLVVIKDKYYKKFMKTMGAGKTGVSAMGGPAHKMLESIYRAQCIKDDTMAESIFQFSKKYPYRKIVHYNGSFHSDEGLGTAQKLLKMNPMLKCAIISIIPVTGAIPKTIRLEDKKNGDYIIYCPRLSNSKKKPMSSKMFKRFMKK